MFTLAEQAIADQIDAHERDMNNALQASDQAQAQTIGSLFHSYCHAWQRTWIKCEDGTLAVRRGGYEIAAALEASPHTVKRAEFPEISHLDFVPEDAE